MISQVLVEAVILAHAIWIAFVLGGFIVILVGRWRGWGIIRSFWLRTVHAVGILVVSGYELAGCNCPLTDLEAYLRARQVQAQFYPRGFIAHYLERWIYLDVPSSWIIVPTIALAIGSLVLYFWVPPCTPFHRQTSQNQAPH